MSGVSQLEGTVAALQNRPSEGFFTTAEVESFTHDLDPIETPTWLAIHFQPAVKHRNLHAYEISQCDAETWAQVKTMTVYVAADAWLARAIKAALIRTAPNVKRFYNDLAKTPSVAESGWALLDKIRKIPMFTIGDEQLEFAGDVATKPYFICGMTRTDAKLACDQFEKDHKLLVEAGAAGNSPVTLLYALLDKLPESEQLEKEKKELKTMIARAQILKAPMLTYEQLSALVAAAVSNAPPAPVANAANGNRARVQCPVCGEMGHTFHTCTLKCMTCKFNFCPGRFQGDKCVVNTTEPVPAQVKNALPNGFIHEGLRNKLVEANAKYNAKTNPGPSASAAELACAVAHDLQTAAAHVGPVLQKH